MAGQRPRISVWCAALVGAFAPAFAQAERAAPKAAAPTLPELQRELRARFPDARRRAVRGLVALGTPEAWELVAGALADRDGQVADTAQLALPAWLDDGGQRALLGTLGLGHSDPWVRVRVAEALGRVEQPCDGLALTRHFDRRAPEVTVQLLWSIERLAQRGLLTGEPRRIVSEVSAELARGRSEVVRGMALLTLAALDSDAAERAARELALDREGAVRAAALEVAALCRVSDLPRWQERALVDDDPRVRAVALRVVGATPTRGALAQLVQRLAIEPRLSLRPRVLDVLRGTTGWRHGHNVAAWKATVDSIPANWDGRPLVAPRERELAPDRSIARIATLDAASDRLAVLIDFSGSLWNTQADGRTRKELLDPEFRAFAEALPEGARFNVIPYTGTPHPWQERLVPVDARTVRDVQTAFARWTMRGQGDAFGAIEVALADPEVDRILLLTDGAPTGGRRWDLPLAIELLLQGCRLRPVTYDVVLVDAPRGTARKWERLTSETGGRLLSVAFAPQR